MSTDRINSKTLLAFGAPAVGAGYMYLLLALYVMKFSTDVLLIAPAIMGLIFSVSRIWDAISDPLVGYLSDRTTTSLGRRRTWILFSFVPIAIGFYAVFAPPFSLSGDALSWWMAASIIGFYSAMTIFFVPHMALGAELSNDYHERSRLFGLRHAFYTFGSILSLATMQLLLNEEFREGGDVRAMAEEYALYAVVAMSVLVLYAVVYLRERPEFQGRLSSSPTSAFRDVWKTPCALTGYCHVYRKCWFFRDCGVDTLCHPVCRRCPPVGPVYYFGLHVAVHGFSANVAAAISPFRKNKGVDRWYGTIRSVFRRDVLSAVLGYGRRAFDADYCDGRICWAGRGMRRHDWAFGAGRRYRLR